MANITELQFQGDSTVHKLNDARITTTAVTTATHILTTNSGVTSITPITTANLASVLGGVVIKYQAAANAKKDLNGCTQVGASYIINPGGTNAYANFPHANGTGLWGSLSVSSFSGGNSLKQVMVGSDVNNVTEVWVRASYQDGVQWESWQRVDNFGCNTPADLASALGAPGIGVFSQVAVIGKNEGDDVANLSKNGLYRVFNNKVISNIPTGITQNIGDIVFAFIWDPNTAHYLYLAIKDNKIFKGRKYNSSVTWNEI